MKASVWAVATALAVCTVLGAEERHAAKGVVLKVDSMHRSLLISCETIPGYMDAMEMPFTVRDDKTLLGIEPGEGIQFTIVDDGKRRYAEEIRPGATATYNSEPMQAGQLAALKSMLDPNSKGLGPEQLAVGEQTPDFALTDQAGKMIHLREQKGKVVALTFGYSRCPNPAYCLRLSNNLARVERRFHEQMGKDLVLMTIMIDPEHDRGETLREYAGVWKADPERWHFLTGSLPEIKQVAGVFGMDFWRVEGALTHPLHTVVIDRKGRLAANLEGNAYTPKELGDLVGTVMAR